LLCIINNYVVSIQENEETVLLTSYLDDQNKKINVVYGYLLILLNVITYMFSPILFAPRLIRYSTIL